MALSTLTPVGRRAERFAAALDGTPLTDPSLHELAAVAQALRSLPLQRVSPDEDFRAALRTRLVAVATVRPPGTPDAEPAGLQRSARWHGQRAMAIATGAFAAVVAVAGVGIAAARSIPGDPFYGVKRDVQAAQLFVTSGAYSRGQEQLGFATDRLNEIARLLGTPTGLGPVVAGEPTAAAGNVSVSELRQVLDDMDAETLAGSRDLTEAFATAHQRAALLALRSFATRQYQRLDALLPEFPAVLRPRVEHSLALLASIRARANALLADGVCGRGCAGPHTDRLGVVPAPAHSRQPRTSRRRTSTATGTGPHSATSSTSSSSQSGGATIVPPPQPTPAPSSTGGLNSLIGGALNPTPAPSSTAPTAPLGPLPTTLLPSSLGTNSLSTGTGSTSSSGSSNPLLPLPNLSPLTNALLP